MIELLLSDLDGVIRHFDPDHIPRVEAQHGLPEGTIDAAAYEPGVLNRLVTGALTMAQWEVHVADEIGSAAAARAWLSDRGQVDPEMMRLVDDVRAAGVRVAVLTNGTDTIDAELEAFGVHDRFDAVFSTADIGVAKPDPLAFRHVCDAMAVDPSRVFFTDDSQSKLAGAVELGIHTWHFDGVSGLRSALHRAGVVTGR